ncbi:MAG: ammonium transporter [Candidatus Solibacter usitatus]|nr:ammonium transporter [Candidatus Solibacter usitatus]
MAQTAPAVEQRLAVLEAAARSDLSARDNAWVLTGAAFVLMMTGPGLVLFYGGLVRKKNVLNTMMQTFVLMALMSVLWVVVGYSLAFADGASVVGGLQHAFLKGVGAAPNPDYAATIPAQTFMAFQMMFGLFATTMICGAFAERMKFSALLLFMPLWMLMVYCPIVHMVWGRGGLLNEALGGPVRCLDFAGGVVVHITAGVSALVCSLYLGKRFGYPSESMKPHSLVLSVAGAGVLWVGWLTLNAGRALGDAALAGSAFIATQLGAAGGTLGWMTAEWRGTRKLSALGAISGAVSGLIGITAASGFVQPMAALLIGFTTALVCHYMVVAVKMRFGYDDTLDVFGLHGAGGTIGALLTGVFATNLVNSSWKDAAGRPVALGWVDGNAGQVGSQLASCGIAWVLAIAGTWAALKICDVLVGLRVSQEQEIQGLDSALHGQEGYGWEP